MTTSKTQSLDNIKALTSLYTSDLNVIVSNISSSKESLEQLSSKLSKRLAAIFEQKAIEQQEIEQKKQEELLKEEALKAPKVKESEVLPQPVLNETAKKSDEKKSSKDDAEKQQGQTQAPVNSQGSAPKAIYVSSDKQFPGKPQDRTYQNQGPQRPYQNQGQGQRTYQNNQGQNPRPNVNYGQTQRPYQNQGQGQRPAGNPNFAQRPAAGNPNFKPNLNRLGTPRVALSEAAKTASAEPPKNKIFIEKKRTFDKPYDDKRNIGKKTLVKKGLIGAFAPNDEDRMGSKKYKTKKSKETIFQERIKIEKAIVNSEIIPIKTLSEKLGITAAEITKKLFKNNIIKTINESIDYESAALLAIDLGIELELKIEKSAEDILSAFHIVEDEKDAKMVKRPPVVTVLGHVDHGKTSLLDAIKKTSVVSSEAGGITQHIGAYTVEINKNPITFIDTPGHEAFTAMRARGAQVTDVAILVVAADDGVMPQTIEALNHAKAAKVPIVVAINKIDKQNADLDRIKQQLSEHNILPEEWGGDAIMVPVSAKLGTNLDKLLEAVVLVSDVLDLKANPKRKAKGTIIEAKLDKGKGPIATVLVQNGTLKVGDTIISGTAIGKIRAMLDDKGVSVKEAGPSYAVAVLGFSEVPNAGDTIFAAEDEKLSRQVLSERVSHIKESMVKSSQKLSLDDAFSKIDDKQKYKNFNIIIKADVQGSVEALKASLLKLSNEEFAVQVVHSGVGAVNDSDVMLAKASDSIIIGFNITVPLKSKQLSDQSNVKIKNYKIIYEAIDDLTLMLKGMLTPKYKEVSIGTVEVRNIFKISNLGVIAGCYVTSGKVTRNALVRVIRDGTQIFEGKISSLKRFKDDVKEVASNFECGICVEKFDDFKELDIINVYNMELIK
ncbi:MAG: translation initiation factor IF-2 [Firmicutes bacterium]|nr:translation initiation factor IF-2 [Bacillota bacterium]